MTGDKKTLLRNSNFDVEDKAEEEPTFSDMCGAIMVIFGSYAVGQLFSGYILPSIFGAPIHEYAYMIIFVVILSATGVIPKNIRAGAKRLQKFVNKAFAVVMMAGLCMANRGGNGDVAVLGAAKRMDLMAYAQLSSRLGGGIVLIIASFLFSFWM